MTYTARKLITEAYYLSGIISRDFQTPTGEQINNGLDWFNQLLASKLAEPSFIPYFQEYDLDAVVGQETYFIPNLVEIETFTFNIGNVRYPSIQVPRKMYRGTARVDGIESLPFSWNFERTKGGANLSLYFLPNSAYKLKIWGKFGFDEVSLDDDLKQAFDGYYINYLEYELAAIVCNKYRFPLPQQTAEWLESMRPKMHTKSPMDLTVQIRSRFGGDRTFDWKMANLFKGFLPPASSY